MFTLLSLVTGVISACAWRAYNSRHWPTTDGVVTAFYETPNYKYSVSGRTYTGSHVSCNEFFNSYLSVGNSSKYAVRYPLEAKVAVHYCPSDPSLAVLETSFDSNIVIGIVVLVVMTGLCFVGFLFGRRVGVSLFVGAGG
jgi:hypothetical protein